MKLGCGNLTATGKSKTAIDRYYQFKQIIEAHRHVETGHKKGNAIITMKT
jgi:D-arabinose 1-dehydrogenase-like Zn-dependent alcohol dehydrogenase